MDLNYLDWENINEDIQASGHDQPSTTVPGSPGDPMNTGGLQPMQQDDPVNSAEMPDLSQDPEHPELPDGIDEQGQDFEVWRREYCQESIKGNVSILIDLLNQVRDRDLAPADRRFVEDNLQVQYLRQQSNVLDASKEVRRGFNEQLDKNNPASTAAKLLQEALEKQMVIKDMFIKTTGYYGMKGDVHRKLLAGLMGAVMMGGSMERRNIIIWDDDLSINLSTRMQADFGEIHLGRWSLKAEDPQRFLSEPEKDKMETGSPEERNTLRHRVMLESICNRFKEVGFIIHIVGEDGTIYNIGLDPATFLKAGYLDGKLLFKTVISDNSEVMVDSDGNITRYMDLNILYAKETGEVDASGKVSTKQVRFIERREGVLYLVAPMDILQEASASIPGLVVTSLPYQGNPSDLLPITRAVFGVNELLSRNP